MSPLATEHAASPSPETPALPEHASPASTGLPDDASQHPDGPRTGAPRKRVWVRILLLLLVLCGIAFVVYRILTNKPKEQGGPGGGGRRGAAGQIVPVAFDVATRRTIPISLQALGTVTAYNTVTLKSRVDGQITKVNFQEGQHVRQGQLLLEIDPRPYQATLSQAQGNLLRDQANAAFTQAESQRYTQLYAAGVVSRESVQTQENTAGQSVGTLAADRAAVQQAQVNLNYTRITSPIDGIVGLRQVDIGNIVTAAGGTGLVVITQVQPIAVIFTLPEDQLPQVFEHMRGGHKLTAEAWDRADTQKLATGSLLTVDNQIDTTTGTAKLKAVFDNAKNELYPNQFVNIHLVLEDRQNSLVIPAAAVQLGNSGSFVYVIDRTKGQMPPANAGGGSGGRRGNNSPVTAGTSAATTSSPSSGDGGGNTGASQGGAAPPSDQPANAGSNPNGNGGQNGASGTNGSGGGRRGGAGGSGPQMNYPVHVVNVVVDSTQGTDVVIKSGLQPGQQVVTDGQEKLQEGSRVIPRPSADMQAARQARANGSANTPPNPDPNANAFSNGRGSDRDPGTSDGTARTVRGQSARPNDSTGAHRDSSYPANADGTASTPNNPGPRANGNGQHRRPQPTNP